MCARLGGGGEGYSVNDITEFSASHIIVRIKIPKELSLNILFTSQHLPLLILHIEALALDNLRLQRSFR